MLSIAKRLLPVIVLAITGCSSDIPTAMVGPHTQPLAASAPAHETINDVYERIARSEIPGFAGLYLDADQSLVILLADSGSGPTGRSYIASHAADLGLPAGKDARLRFVKYDFATLHEWEKTLEPSFLTRLGVHMWSIDQKNNRLWFAVSDDAKRSEAQRAIMNRGLPKDAIQVETTARSINKSYIDAMARPLVGGIAIITQAPVQAPRCTAGFTALQDGVWYLVTAAHCSHAQFQIDSSLIWQPDSTSSNFLMAFETKDRGCTFVWSCRYSDASMFQYISQSPADSQFVKGRLIRTTYADSSLAGGSSLIDSTNKYFRVVAEANPVLGTLVNKIGWASGWTLGAITDPCTNIANSDGNVLLCQVRARLVNHGGDSGSPVFIRTGITVGGMENVNLLGILWGSPVDDEHVADVSPISGIENDLGAVDVVELPPAPPSATINGPDAIRPGVNCTWGSSTTISSPSYTWKIGSTVVGTSSTLRIARFSSFTLDLTVTNSSGDMASDSKVVDVRSTNPACT